jgi:hypothetical protein
MWSGRRHGIRFGGCRSEQNVGTVARVHPGCSNVVVVVVVVVVVAAGMAIVPWVADTGTDALPLDWTSIHCQLSSAAENRRQDLDSCGVGSYDSLLVPFE